MKRFLYALLILWGVITVIFFLFNVLPGDPAQMMLGQRTDISTVESIRKELGLDRSVGMQYVKYINDLSPVSVHHAKNEASYFYLDPEKYSPYHSIFTIHKKYTLVLKKPYLRRPYQSKKQVSAIISETLPNTFILAIASIVFATFLGLFIGIIVPLKKILFSIAYPYFFLLLACRFLHFLPP